MPSVMQNGLKVWICLLVFIFLFYKSVGRPLLGISIIDPLVKPLTSALDFKKGSKLQLLEMLTSDLLSTPDGGVVGEGDIVQYHTQTKGQKDDGDLWPDAVIPYLFHDSVDQEHKNLLKESMTHWEEHTCIRFKRRTKKDKHYLRFRTDTSGCWSAVGRQFDRPGPQDISLGQGCFKFYTAIHELGHTIGYFHEHSRNDRDQFVEILWENVKPGMKVQFAVKNTRNENFEYDYKSIMHYPAWAFSKTPLKENVILSKNPFSQYQIDEEKNAISFRDIKLTNHLYKCNQKCSNLEQIECQNDGILVLNKSKGSHCTCLCPPGFRGELCQDIDQKTKIDLAQPKCGGNITEEGVISTPDYPIRKEFQSCSYWIRAPVGQRVKVTFEDFSFAKPYGAKSGVDGLCLYENVEIRKSENIYQGSIYCGEQIEPNTEMESDERDFIIVIIADDQKRGRGFNASVQFLEGQSSEDKDKDKDKEQQKSPKVIKPKTNNILTDVLKQLSIR